MSSLRQTILITIISITAALPALALDIPNRGMTIDVPLTLPRSCNPWSLSDRVEDLMGSLATSSESKDKIQAKMDCLKTHASILLSTSNLAGQNAVLKTLVELRRFSGSAGSEIFVSLADIIEPLLKNPEASLRIGAIDVLYAINSYDSALKISDLFFDPSPEVRYAADTFAPFMKHPEILPAMVAALKLETVPENILRLVQSMNGPGVTSPEAEDLVASYLTSPRKVLQEAAIQALGSMGAVSKKDILINLKPMSSLGRAFRIQALAQMQYQLSESEITSALRNGGGDERTAALGMVKQFRVTHLRPLVEQIASHDRNAIVRDVAREALLVI